VDDHVLDELYSAPLDEFIARRTTLAKQLKAEGRPDEAAEVGGARKPSVPLWTVNQLARRNKPAVKKLVESSDALRKALAKGDHDAFAAAQRAQTDALGKLRDAARSLLGKATDPVLERVVSAFRTAAVDDGLRGALSAGRLTEEPEASGFDALAGLSFAPSGTRKQPETPKRSADRVKQATKALQEAKAEAREREREAREAERAAEKARKTADEAAAAVEQAEEALASARRR
jgi:methyl-accepting chemotaxis protein